MGHSSIRPKVRRRKVAALAAYSRQFSVKNTKKGISEKINHKLYYGDLKNAITNPFTGHKFVPTNPHPIPLGRGNATITGYEWVEPVGMLWEHKRYKQPKRLAKIKKTPKHVACNDFVRFFPNYPYTIKPLTKEAYWEKLVEHKLKKWEKKNPKPNQDLFESTEEWKQKRFVAEQRFRDFVVSCYNKLPIMGNIVDRKNHKLKAIKIGEVKDIDGKGHNVNHPNLSPNDKLYKHAEAVAMSAMEMDKRILDADLLNHKHDQKRPLNITRQSAKKAA